MLQTGAPSTLRQAQDYISQGPLGQRITWVQEDPMDYLSSLASGGAKTFYATVLAHSLLHTLASKEYARPVREVAEGLSDKSCGASAKR